MPDALGQAADELRAGASVRSTLHTLERDGDELGAALARLGRLALR